MMELLVSLVQKSTTLVQFTFGGQAFSMKESLGHHSNVSVESIVFLGFKTTPKGCSVDGQGASGSHNGTNGGYTVQVGKSLTRDFNVTINH